VPLKTTIDRVVSDKRVSLPEARAISTEAAGTSKADVRAQLEPLLKAPDLTFGTGARKLVEDVFQKAAEAPRTPAEGLWSHYFPNTPLPAGQALKRALTVTAALPPLLSADAATLCNNGLRNKLMTVEALLDLYKTQYPALSGPAAQVKQLEDAIGRARQPQSPEETARAERDLVALATQWFGGPNGTSPVLQGVLSALAQVPFGTDADDRAFLKKGIVAKVHQIGTTAFDMNDLQGRNGIHDLRKEVRWVRYYLDLVAVADGPTNLLPSSLVAALDDANGTLSDIKDRGETADAAAHRIARERGVGVVEARRLATEQLGPTYAESALHAEAAVAYDKVKAAYAANKDALGVN